VQTLVRDLNKLYVSNPALHETDCLPEGFQWIDCHDSDNSVIAYLRLARDPDDFLAVVCNFTPVVRSRYRLGVPKAGAYAEVLNSDAGCYAGSGIGNAGRVDTEARESHGRPFSLVLDLPPLGALILKPVPPASQPEPETSESKPEATKQQAEAEGASDDIAAADSGR
jgi:1,4-alpha-glucan branching enzyme